MAGQEDVCVRQSCIVLWGSKGTGNWTANSFSLEQREAPGWGDGSEDKAPSLSARAESLGLNPQVACKARHDGALLKSQYSHTRWETEYTRFASRWASLGYIDVNNKEDSLSNKIRGKNLQLSSNLYTHAGIH